MDPFSTSFIYMFVLFLFALFMNQCSGLRLSQVPTVAGICLCVCPMQLVEVEDTSRQQASTSSTSPPHSPPPNSPNHSDEEIWLWPGEACLDRLVLVGHIVFCILAA